MIGTVCGYPNRHCYCLEGNFVDTPERQGRDGMGLSQHYNGIVNRNWKLTHIGEVLAQATGRHCQFPQTHMHKKIYFFKTHVRKKRQLET